MRLCRWTCILALAAVVLACNKIPKEAVLADHLPAIFPEYAGIVIPVNIAPLNFIIEEPGDEFRLRFSGKQGDAFVLNARQKKVLIPVEKWKQLLRNTVNDTIRITVFGKSKGVWNQYRDIAQFVSADSIDPFLVYRKINPALVGWQDMAIMQYDLESNEESAILENKNTGNNCMHCHTFQDRNPDHMMLHLRTPPGGTLIHTQGGNHWLDTKTAYTVASFAYPAWHPKENLIACSTNKIHQLMYGAGHRLNYVFDDVSDIVLYDIDKNLVSTTPRLAGNGLENLPNWSPDGNWLYYINCPGWRKQAQGKRVQYDLMRIAFNAATREWGMPDTLLTAEKTGMSITFPEASPDGKYLLVCMADYGYFTIGNTSSDLYLYDLQQKNIRKLEVNSPSIESFHSWSSNSRWFVFASKRYDGIITLPYFAYLDSTGRESKPFVIPAADPESHKTRLYNFNRPVLVKGRVMISQDEILSEIYKPTSKVVFDSLHVAIDSLSGRQSATDHGEGSLYRKN